MLVPKQIAAIATLASVDSTRPNLCNVHLTRRDGKAVAEVTDGKRAMIVAWDEPSAEGWPDTTSDTAKAEDFDALLPAKQFPNAFKGCPKVGKHSILSNVLVEENIVNETAILKTSDGKTTQTTQLGVCDMPYPKIPSVVPDYSDPEKHVTIALDAVLMAELLMTMTKAALKNEKWDAKVVKLTIPKDVSVSSENVKIRIDAVNTDGVESAVGILMNYRIKAG